MWHTKLTSINSKQGKWKLILITGIFAFVFTNVFEPFGIYNSLDKNDLEIFLEINIAITSVFVALILSQFIIRNLLKITSFTYLSIVFWFLFESILIGALWSLLTILIDGNNPLFFNLWITNIVECIFLIGLPYFATLTYLSFKEKTKTVIELQDSINEQKIDQNTVISFKESSNKEKLSIRLGDIFYIESDDNYIIVHFSINKQLEKMMLRNSIKKMEVELLPYGIIRCHRSYMVNPINISRKEKTTKGLNLFFKTFEQSVVPVSKTYISELDKIFKH